MISEVQDHLFRLPPTPYKQLLDAIVNDGQSQGKSNVLKERLKEIHNISIKDVTSKSDQTLKSRAVQHKIQNYCGAVFRVEPALEKKRHRELLNEALTSARAKWEKNGNAKKAKKAKRGESAKTEGVPPPSKRSKKGGAARGKDHDIPGEDQGKKKKTKKKDKTEDKKSSQTGDKESSQLLQPNIPQGQSETDVVIGLQTTSHNLGRGSMLLKPSYLEHGHKYIGSQESGWTQLVPQDLKRPFVSRASTFVGKYEKLLDEKTKGEDAEPDDAMAVLGTLSKQPVGEAWEVICSRKVATKLISNYPRSNQRQEQSINNFPVSVENAPRTLRITIPPRLDDIWMLQTNNHICGILECHCSTHRVGETSCGSHLQKNDVIFLCGSNMKLQGGLVYYVPAYKVSEGRHLGCNVGYVKALFNEVQFVANRTAQVTKVHAKGSNSKDASGDRWIHEVGGIARISFLDRGLIHQAGAMMVRGP